MTWDVSDILEQYNLGYEPDIKAITVTVSRGVVSIRESWRDEAEIWSDGVTARMPASVWKNVVGWIDRLRVWIGCAHWLAPSARASANHGTGGLGT
jgi:hypothetical protein